MEKYAKEFKEIFVQVLMSPFSEEFMGEAGDGIIAVFQFVLVMIMSAVVICTFPVSIPLLIKARERDRAKRIQEAADFRAKVIKHYPNLSDGTTWE
jgi:hypothetical protein